MNKKGKTAFVCTECGQEFTKWQGRCHNCNAWETVVEFHQPKVAASQHSRAPLQEPCIKNLDAATQDSMVRIESSFVQFDRVLGGGAVPGGLILIGGDPGIGKSTLLLQVVSQWAERGRKALYISGEESFEQVALRGRRTGVATDKVGFYPETRAEIICQTLQRERPELVVIDSIQTMYCESLESAPGSVSQVRETTAQLLRTAKEQTITIFIVGHVTKEGALAGPRLLEHMVDTVLYFEGDNNYQYRILRSVKNRFGPSGEIALFSMSDRGLSEVSNAADIFLLSGPRPQVGSAVVPVVEGSRVLAVELQTLVNRTHFGLPQRVASGINPKKLALLIAVLERHGGIVLGDHDIFFNVAGGLTVGEPAIDLGICAALISSFRNKPLRIKSACIGELGLGGELRTVNNMETRIRELVQLGFETIIVPSPRRNSEWARGDHKQKLQFCTTISDVQDALFD
jgi:DNA repair protein RadA/Sms